MYLMLVFISNPFVWKLEIALFVFGMTFFCDKTFFHDKPRAAVRRYDFEEENNNNNVFLLDDGEEEHLRIGGLTV